ncbi:MAG: DUF87 domain-containing protein [Gammaproteobacteria bacterium]
MTKPLPRLNLSSLYGPSGKPAAAGALAPAVSSRAPLRPLGAVSDDGAPFFIDSQNRQAHTHILGGTKRGKSVLMEMLIRRDLEDPDCSLCLIDPHRGSTYDNLVRYIATERPDLAKRVVLFNPSEQTGTVLGFNPLGKYARENPHYALNMMVSACLKAWGQDRTDRTPRITRWLENIFYLIIANGLTLLEVAPLISSRKNNPHRDALLQQVQNFFIEEDWNDFREAPNSIRNQYLEGAHNRLRKFLRNPSLQQVFGQQNHVLDIEDIIANRKILLVKLPDGKQIDRESNQLVGALLIHEIFRAILDRDPQQNPHNFYLYIDEFAQFVTREIAYLLEEARKYGLYLTLAHQHLAQLREQDEYVYASVLTNCHNRAVFGGLSYDDAEIIDREINTGFRDLLEIKDRVFSTRFRPVQEWQESYGLSLGRSQGSSHAFGVAFGQSLNIGQALARGTGQSVTETDGNSRQVSHSLDKTKALSRQKQRSNSVARAKTDGTNLTVEESSSTGEQRSESSTRSEEDSYQHANNIGTSVQDSQQHATGRHLSFPPSGAQLTTHNQFTNGSAQIKQNGTTDTHGRRSGRSSTSTQAVLNNRGNSLSQGLQQSQSLTDTDTGGETDGVTESISRAVSLTLGRQHSHAVGHSENETRTANVTAGQNEQRSATQTDQDGHSQNLTVNWSLLTRYEEFQEEHHSFWSPEEHRERAIGRLKQQPTGVCTCQIGPTSPVQINVDYRPAMPYNSAYTPRRLAFLERQVVAAHPHFYLPSPEALAEIRKRQEDVFGEALDIDFSGETLLTAPLADDPSPTPVPDEGPTADGAPGAIRFADDDD